MAYILGNLGRSCINFKDLGSKGKYFKGAEELSFRDLGGSMHYFQGSREHRPAWGLFIVVPIVFVEVLSLVLVLL